MNRNKTRRKDDAPKFTRDEIIIYIIVFFLVFSTAIIAFLFWFPDAWLPWARPWLQDWSWLR